MQICLNGQNITIVVPFTDSAGNEVVPYAVILNLYDNDGEHMVSYVPIVPAPGDTSVSIEVQSLENTIPLDVLTESRTIRAEFMFPTPGSIFKYVTYAIRQEQRLVVMVNSFIGYEAALVQAHGMVNLTGFTLSTEDKQVAALSEAFRRITRIPLRYFATDEFNRSMRAEETIIEPQMWAHITPAEFKAMPENFRRALIEAQIVEANELAQGDTYTRRHRAGVRSETIGESSVTLQAGAFVDTGVSSQTMSILRGFVYKTMRIARA